jgi:deoxyribonuclease V
MILAVDVQYTKNEAIAAGVLFEHWQDERAQKEYLSRIEGVAGYEPGKFFKRELPPILKLIEEHHLQPDCILVDGFVFLDGFAGAGLGKHLYDALGGKVAVIGVAKKQYKDLDAGYEVRRGRSRRPLYVTAVGIEVEEAKGHILSMHGSNRLPTLIKRADQVCRGVGMG